MGREIFSQGRGRIKGRFPVKTAALKVCAKYLSQNTLKKEVIVFFRPFWHYAFSKCSKEEQLILRGSTKCYSFFATV